MATVTTTTPPPLPDRPLIRLRFSIAVAALALLGLACWRLSFVQGLVRRITIDGPSMAPTLLNEHYAIQCGDCGFRFVLDAEHPPADGRAVCPNCGYAANSLADILPRPADRVLIDRWRLLGSIRRGEVIAAALPQAGPGVKRIAGLPGERLAIQAGELYANRQLVRKSPAELRPMRVLVHDNSYPPQKTPGLPPRWRPLESSSRWETSDGGFQIKQTTESDNLDWLIYQHWACTGHLQQSRAALSAIYDYDSYNQGDNRALHRVSDVLLSCRVQSMGAFAFAVKSGGERFEVLIEPGQRIVVSRGGTRLQERPLAARPFRFAAEVLFGLCDQQLLLTADGRTLLQMPYDLEAMAAPSELQSLAIGARGSADVSELKVWRDIYYLPPAVATWDMAASLPENQVALLGDNPPVSIDSRQWQPAGVSLDKVLGRVYRPFWSDRR